MGVLGAALTTGVLGGFGVGALLGPLIGVLNGWSPGTDMRLLSGYLAGLYAAVFSLGLVVAALGLLAMGGRPGPRVSWALFHAWQEPPRLFDLEADDLGAHEDSLRSLGYVVV